MVKLSSRSIIGLHASTSEGQPFYAADPSNGQPLQPGFLPATPEEVELAVRQAADAFAVYSRTPGQKRGEFLRKIAENIESIADELIERAGRETALPQARLQSETARTCDQLRLFAQVAEESSWVQAHIDRADPDRKPTASAGCPLHAASARAGGE